MLHNVTLLWALAIVIFWIDNSDKLKVFSRFSRVTF